MKSLLQVQINLLIHLLRVLIQLMVMLLKIKLCQTNNWLMNYNKQLLENLKNVKHVYLLKDVNQTKYGYIMVSNFTINQLNHEYKKAI